MLGHDEKAEMKLMIMMMLVTLKMIGDDGDGADS